MALRYRGRSKGKGAWLNWSWSKKHGLNTSVSVKSGPFTWNSGNGKTTKKRVTTNLPGGFYHVSTEKSERRSRSEPHREYVPTYSTQALTNAITNIVGFVAITASVWFLFTYPWWTLGIAFVCWLWYLGSKK